MSNGLSITADRSCKTACRLILQGQISSAEANTFEFELEEACRKGHSDFILNMRQVAYLCSSGIRVLLKFYKRAKAAGGSFYVENPSENVINVLGMTALDEMLLRQNI